MPGSDTRYTPEEAHLMFAKKLHGEVWNLLGKPARTREEDERMVHAAHASCYHWLQVGTIANHQRSEWLIARAYAVTGQGEQALIHAERCLALTLQHPADMADFDVAFAYECLARAHAVLGNREEALAHFRLAETGGESIADAEDRAVFFDSLRGGDWRGVR